MFRNLINFQKFNFKFQGIIDVDLINILTSDYLVPGHNLGFFFDSATQCITYIYCFTSKISHKYEIKMAFEL